MIEALGKEGRSRLKEHLEERQDSRDPVEHSQAHMSHPFNGAERNAPGFPSFTSVCLVPSMELGTKYPCAWKDGRMDGWLDGQMDGWRNAWRKE